MTVSCIGDSLTEGDYGIRGRKGIPNVHEKNYPFFLAEELGCNIKNYGKCGFRSVEYLDYYMSGKADLEGSDIVLIMLGTNGGHSLEKDTEANRAYRTLVRKIRADVPQAAIYLLTPPHVTDNPELSNCGYSEQVKTAAEFVKNLAEAENTALIDIAGYAEFSAENEWKYQSNDGLHFVERGYQELASFIARRLRRDFAER